MKLNKEAIATMLSERMSAPIKVIAAHYCGSGHFAHYWRIETDKKPYWVKTIRSEDPEGWASPEHHLRSFQVSHRMTQENAGPRSILIGTITPKGAFVLPEVSEGCEIVQIAEWRDGISYEKFVTPLKAGSNRHQARNALSRVAKLAANIHTCPIFANERTKAIFVYNRFLHGILEHATNLAGDFSSSHPILPHERMVEIIKLMYDLKKKWVDKYWRLRALHGDFWFANVLFKKSGEPFAVDFSRTPYGEPGWDIGWWIAEYWWLYYKTGNGVHAELSNHFISEYVRITGDEEISRTLLLALGVKLIVKTSPRYMKPEDLQAGKKFAEHFLTILREQKVSL